jgi:hypothetical protein
LHLREPFEPGSHRNTFVESQRSGKVIRRATIVLATQTGSIMWRAGK